MIRYREYESAENLADEQQAALRVQQHWRGLVREAEQYLPYDRVLVDTDGRTAALLEIKVRHYPMRFFIDRNYMISHSKVRSLCAAAKQRQSVPLIMVVCDDDDFLIDLRDETGISISVVPAINDRWYDEHTGITDERSEHMAHFAGHRFLPLFTLPNLF